MIETVERNPRPFWDINTEFNLQSLSVSFDVTIFVPVNLPRNRRAASIPVLETETHVTSIESHLEELQVKTRYRQRTAGQTRLISSFCKEIERKLRGKAGQNKLAETDPRNAQTRMGQNYSDQRHTHRSPNAAPTLDHAYGATYPYSQCSKDESQRSHESHKSAL